MNRDGSDPNEPVVLTIPGRAEFLRLVRLAAADSGARAAFSVGDIEDLRIAVDELAFALIDGAASDGAGSVPVMTLRYVARAGVVEVCGECDAGGGPIELGELSRTIVNAVVDVVELDGSDGVRRFRCVKRGTS